MSGEKNNFSAGDAWFDMNPIAESQRSNEGLARKTPSVLYLYFNPRPRDQIQESTFAGICRYVETRGWQAVAWSKATPDRMTTFLRAQSPVAGCVVECSDDNATLPPRLFGRIPVVYLHAAPALYGKRRIRHVEIDNNAVARAAFRELSAGLPAAYAAVGDVRDFSWSRARTGAFRRLANASGMKCRVFPHGEVGGCRAARLAKWIVALPSRTAVFAVNDFTAAEVAAAARSAGRAIPGELTLLGVDNIAAVCEASLPTLTSIQLDFEREGYLAAKMLAPFSSSPVSVPPLMAMRRESTQGPRKGAANILAAIERIRREACSGLMARDVIASSPGSKSLFNLRFREATGHSVHDEIEHVRMEKVFTLLDSTDTAPGAIAAMCGYRSNIALHKAFRLKTGMSMSEWRAVNRR